MEIIKNILLSFNYFVGFYYFLLNSFYTIFLVFSFLAILNYLKTLKYLSFQELKIYPQLPPITIIIPVYNEQIVVFRTIRSALAIDYPYTEIIVINDGSTDNTLKLMIEEFKLKKLPFFIYREQIKTYKVLGYYFSEIYPNLIVIDKEKGGKFDAVNCGINIAQSPYVCTVDADSFLEKESLLRLARKILDKKDPVLALGGVVRVLNGVRLENYNVKDIELPKKNLPIFQVVEYIRGFLFGRLGLEKIKGTLNLSGTFTLLNKEALLKIGGFKGDTVTEDLEVILRLHKYYRDKKLPYYIGFIPDPVCWTEVPEKISELSKQRRRWNLGLLQSLWNYRSMFFNPKYGRIGFMVMPFYLLEAMGGMLEIIGYFAVLFSYLLGILSFEFLVLFLFLAVGYGIFLSVGGVFLEEMSFRRYPHWIHVFKLLLYGVAENLGYRQLISLFRFQSTIQFFLGKKKWELVKKKG